MKTLINFIEEGAKKKTPTFDSVKGKSAENNGTGGKWALNELTDNDAVPDELDKSDLDKNTKRLLMRFKQAERSDSGKGADFFIIGRAGWGKTSIIKDMAKRFKRNVITVYLDKAAKEDLGGIPVPMKGKTGAVQEMAMPAWAKIMQDNSDKKFLLFFDEMNQADPDIMNALMPIVLEHEVCGVKFDNFFVGAAGNFESENGAVNELSGPLLSRFKPLIVWETGGEAWNKAFKHLHKKWDDKLSPELIDKIQENKELFDNPREVEHKLLDYIYSLVGDDDLDVFDVDDYLDRLEGIAKDDLSRSEEAEMKKLAEYIYNFLNKKDNTEKGGRSGKGRDMVPESVREAIKYGMKFGYIKDGNTKYGISEENISSVVDENDCNAEMLERIINKFKEDGLDFKFKKNSEWQEKGYADPS